MGTCATILKPTHPVEKPSFIFTYPKKLQLKLKAQQFPSASQEPLEIVLTNPISTSIESVSILNHNYWISSSILPGQDPHCNYFQKCLDSCMYLSNTFSLLLCLFDGHGPEGEQVVSYCCGFTTRYYKTKSDMIKSNPEIFLKDLIECCDNSLRSSSTKINTDYSGTTAVFVLIFENHIYSASVGDSRAVLGSYSKRQPLVGYKNREENSALAEIKLRRGSKLPREIFCLQLTQEHKPEDKEEATRIMDAGGRIKRITDTEGNRVGPYRVWESHSNSPGLTLSRSIGDNVAKSIGVIATPDISHCIIDEINDLFIVIGSDGLWDSMNNEDVIRYIECYREKSTRSIKKTKEIPTLSNSCIAHLVCEEARVRWLALVEEDDVSIDDISCIILELNKGNSNIASVQNIRKRSVVADNIDLLNDRKDERVIVDSSSLKDPKRGSQIGFEGKLPGHLNKK